MDRMVFRVQLAETEQAFEVAPNETILAAALDSDVADLKARIGRGALAGPRIVASSRIVTAKDGHPVPMYKALIPWPVSLTPVHGSAGSR